MHETAKYSGTLAVYTGYVRQPELTLTQSAWKLAELNQTLGYFFTCDNRL